MTVAMTQTVTSVSLVTVSLVMLFSMSFAVFMYTALALTAYCQLQHCLSEMLCMRPAVTANLAIPPSPLLTSLATTAVRLFGLHVVISLLLITTIALATNSSVSDCATSCCAVQKEG